MNETLVCRKCNAEKSVTEFYTRKTSSTGYYTRCKTCYNKPPVRYPRPPNDSPMWCPRCEEYKLAIDFATDSARSRGVQSACKVCLSGETPSSDSMSMTDICEMCEQERSRAEFSLHGVVRLSVCKFCEFLRLAVYKWCREHQDASPAPSDFFARCNGCKEVKSSREFPLNSERTNGLAINCHPCAIDWFFRDQLAGASQRSVTYSREFAITLSDMYRMWIAKDGRCKTTSYPLRYDRFKGAKPHNMSIDRIDSSKGYTPDNIQLVTNMFNMSKKNYTMDAFVDMCHGVASTCPLSKRARSEE